MKLKKLLSVFVSLALLLSLISVPVFADGNNVAQIGGTEYATLTAAITAANAGDTITLLNDATVNTGSSTGRYPISKSLTIDGGNHTITINGRGFGVGMNAASDIDVTFKNVTITNSTNAGRCVDTRGHINSLTLDNVVLATTGTSGYLQPLTIGGNQSTVAEINIVNSTIKTSEDGSKGYAIITFNPVDMTITDSTIKGWACFYAKSPDGSAGSKGSTFTVTDSTLVSMNPNSGYSNAFGTIVIEDAGITFDISDCDISIDGSANDQYLITYNHAYCGRSGGIVDCEVLLGDGNNVNLEARGDYAYGATSDNTIQISGGTFNKEVPDELVAEDYVAIDNNDGTWTVKEINYVAQIGETKYATLAAAISATNAMENATITLLKDYDMEANEPGYGWTTLSHSARENVLVISGNVTFDLGGHTLSNLFNNTFKITGNVTVQNGEMRVGQYTNGNSCSYVMMTGEGANLVVNNLTTFGGINVSAATATINNLSFSGTTFYAVCSQDNAVVTINNGTYTKAVPGAANYLFWVEAGSVMNITGGTFIKGTAKFNNGKVYPIITGGTFDFDPTNYGVASGYEVVDNNNGTWTVKSSYDAQIGETKYATLEDAVEAANAGDTIVLLNDITYDADHSVAVWEKGFNLDLNGHTFTTNSGVGKDLSNMGYTATAICFAVEEEASVSNGTIRTAYGAGIYAAAATVTLSGLDVESNTVGVQSTPEYSSAVRLTSRATVIIESGSYKGVNAIAVSNSGGDVTVNGGDFDGKIFFSTGTNSGVSKSITINGGNFTNVSFENTNKGKLTIYGGTFDNDPTAYVATGYEAVDNNNGTWTVGKVKVGELTQTATNEGFDATYTVTKQVVDSDDGVIDEDAASRTVNVKLVDTIVSDDKAIASENNSIDNIKMEEVLGEAVADTSATDNINVEIQVVRDKPDLDTTNNTITYEVHPEAIVYVNGVETKTVAISNDALADTADITITLPVPDALAALAVNGKIRVIHISEGYDDEVLFHEVLGDAGNYYIQFNVSHFSEFELGSPLFTGHSISLNGYVDLNFYLNVTADQVTTGTGTVVDFTWDRGAASYQIETTDYVAGKGYKATVRVPAAEMSYMINAKVTINGVLQTETSTNSVREYALTVLANADPTNDAKLISLVKTMLDYGAKAQVAFGRTDVVLANAGVDYTMPNASRNDLLDAIDTAIYAANGRYADNMLTVASNIGASGYYSSSLIYLTGCTLRHYFTGPGLSGNYDGVKSGYYYYKEVTDIAAADLDTLQAFTVNGTTFYYSALDFVKAIVYNYDSGSNYDLAAATYWYNQAANAYFD